MSTTTTPRAEIRNTRSKKQPFRVNYFAKNGEKISTTETLSTQINAEKNIVAHINAFGGGGIVVHDLTNGKVYNMFADGSKEDIK